jgi:hypothetical protein
MLSLILPLLNGLLGNIITPFVKAWTDYKLVSLKTTEEGFVAAAGADADVYKAYVAAMAQVQQMKVAQQGSLIGKLMMLLFGVPAAAHWGAVFLDSTFKFGWGVPALPGGYANAELSIALSFFVITPAMPLVSAAAQWLGRK